MKGFAWLAIAIIGVFVLGYALATGTINAIVPGIGTDLGYMIEYQFDAVNPEFIDGAERVCEDGGGTWVSSANKIGCFNIPEGTFDTSSCSGYGYEMLEVSCRSVQATFYCEETKVGCSY